MHVEPSLDLAFFDSLSFHLNQSYGRSTNAYGQKTAYTSTMFSWFIYNNPLLIRYVNKKIATIMLENNLLQENRNATLGPSVKTNLINASPLILLSSYDLAVELILYSLNLHLSLDQIKKKKTTTDCHQNFMFVEPRAMIIGQCRFFLIYMPSSH